MKLLKDGGVSILKCNVQEAKALLDEEVSSVFYGVDSQAMNPEQVKIWAYSLWKKYEPLNKKIIVIIPERRIISYPMMDATRLPEGVFYNKALLEQDVC